MLHIVFTCIRQESANKWYRNAVKDLLPNIVNQKDEKPHTTRLDDSAIPHIKNIITEIPLKEKLNNPQVPLLYLNKQRNYLCITLFRVKFVAVTPQATQAQYYL